MFLAWEGPLQSDGDEAMLVEVRRVGQVLGKGPRLQVPLRRSDQGFWEGLGQIPLKNKVGGSGLRRQARV